MSSQPVNQLPEQTVFTGRLFEVVHQEQPDGRNFEIARRAPGVRLIIADKQGRKVLLTREFRQELQDWDYRLPGGKVFDSLEEYEAHRRSGEGILAVARLKAIAEGSEEAGIAIEELELLKKSTLGATVEWDLYIFQVNRWHELGGQSLEDGEIIETGHWFNYDEAETMILNGEMQEERIALALLQWIKRQEKTRE